MCFVVYNTMASAEEKDKKNRYSLGLKLGVGLSNSFKPISESDFSNLGFHGNGGLVALIPITNKRFSLSPELIYSLRMFTGDMDNITYQISYLEVPVLLNIRFFEIDEFYGYRTINFELGLGYGKPLNSRVRTDKMVPDDKVYGWHSYRQITRKFQNPQSQTSFIIGVNSRLSGKYISTISLRYTQLLKGLYEELEGLNDFNLGTKAYSISLGISICL